MYRLGNRLFLILKLLLILSSAGLLQCGGYAAAPSPYEYYYGPRGYFYGGDLDDWNDSEGDFDEDFEGDEGDEGDEGGDRD